MSCNYADGLSPYEDKGKLGIPEKFDSLEEVAGKILTLSKWIKEAKHVVMHTGAGISTPAGIPDFRGPKGVWTLEKKGLKPQINVSFDDAEPTFTHMAIIALFQKNFLHYVVSQNIDGLHLKSGLDRSKLSELHGNMFIGQCSLCSRQYIRRKAVTSVGQRELPVDCPALKGGKLSCRGKLHDTILDWEHELPVRDLGLADIHSNVADLSICLGTTLQIVPSGTLPLATKRKGGRLVIINLQPTKWDKKADLVINTYVDDVMKLLLKELNTPFLPYDPKCDPTRQPLSEKEMWQEEFTKREWTLAPRVVNTTRKRLSHLETKAQPKPKKMKQKHQEEPSPSQLNSPGNSGCQGEGSKQLDMVEPVKVELAEEQCNGLKDEQQDDYVIVTEKITGKKLKQETLHMQSENGEVQSTTNL
ncbi:NAD-dependent deacetylase sirtuin-6 [Daphnia magna]|uniref:protein acetyllysine N-acetyltransferase n=1 Tax=Daphnia magna TaxID=35525 RepID=A0A162SQA7_9CRUS|nr:NAD-dependent deacetylase sirtuin-6 [Daphnia magna]